MDSDDDRMSDKYKLKQKLLRKAFAGKSSMDGPSMIAFIDRITSENRQDMPDEHKEKLFEAIQDDGQPRSVRALNAIARELGMETRYSTEERVITVH